MQNEINKDNKQILFALRRTDRGSDKRLRLQRGILQRRDGPDLPPRTILRPGVESVLAEGYLTREYPPAGESESLRLLHK